MTRECKSTYLLSVSSIFYVFLNRLAEYAVQHGPKRNGKIIRLDLKCHSEKVSLTLIRRSAFTSFTYDSMRFYNQAWSCNPNVLLFNRRYVTISTNCQMTVANLRDVRGKYLLCWYWITYTVLHYSIKYSPLFLLLLNIHSYPI